MKKKKLFLEFGKKDFNILFGLCSLIILLFSYIIYQLN